MSKYCWLCDYNCEPEARKINKFLADNAGTMSVSQMASAVHNLLRGFIQDQNGIELETIKEHINSHTLMPALRVASILRSLLGLNEKLSTILASEDEDGNVVIDNKNVTAYLKVTDEIMQMYKSGNVNRLLFSDTSTEPTSGQMQCKNAGGGQR